MKGGKFFWPSSIIYGLISLRLGESAIKLRVASFGEPVWQDVATYYQISSAAKEVIRACVGGGVVQGLAVGANKHPPRLRQL